MAIFDKKLKISEATSLSHFSSHFPVMHIKHTNIFTTSLFHALSFPLPAGLANLLHLSYYYS